MLRGRLAPLDIKNGGRSNTLNPRVTLEDTHSQDCRFVKRFRLHLRDMPDAAHVDERHGTTPQRHGRSYHIRVLFARYRAGPERAPTTAASEPSVAAARRQGVR